MGTFTLGGSQIAKWGGGTLAIAVGFRMLTNGFVTHSILLSTIGIVQGELPGFIGGIVGLSASVAVGVIAALISLGGLTVIVGGSMILLKHRTLGRLLIALGGVVGFIGLLIAFGYTAYTIGLGTTIGNAPYWIGVVLAVVGRRAAKRA